MKKARIVCSLVGAGAIVVLSLYLLLNSHSNGTINTTKQLIKLSLLRIIDIPVIPHDAYPNIPTLDSNESALVQLHWTTLGGTNEDNSYHFFSAYYDGRTSKNLQRPAVIVMGYVNRKVPSIKFYCLFRYNNRSTCKEKPANERHVSPCFPPNLSSRPYHYVCEVLVDEEVPLAVHLSMSEDCKPDSISAPIPVQNRDAKIEEKPAKKFGVCLGGPLVQENANFLRDVVEYVEMSIAVGVQQIVFYVNEKQVDKSLLEYLWKHYPDVVKTIAWRKFDKWVPMHYYGQLLMMSDCFYRHMYEVEYLAMTDLDEMITPVGKHTSWGEMIKALNSNSDVSSYTFQNAFFTSPENEAKQVLPNCSNAQVPKYFTRTVRHDCYPGYAYRPKTMSLARYIYEPNIHWVCARVDGHPGNTNVPTEIGILAHYRPSVPDDCVGKPTFTDNVARKFRNKVTDSMC